MRLFASQVYAQDGPPQLGQLFESLDKILGFVHPIGVTVAAAMLITGGFMWITSGGDPSRKQQAQAVLTWAVIGLVFLFLVRGIMVFLLTDIISPSPSPIPNGR